MTTFEMVKYGYEKNLVSKDEVLSFLSNGKISYQEYTDIVGYETITITEVDADGNETTRTESVPPTVSLEIVKQAKIGELDSICNAEILEGFYSNAKGNMQKYDLHYENQINLTGIQMKIMKAIILQEAMPEITWYASDQTLCEVYTPEEFLKLCEDAEKFKTDRINKYKELKLQVENAETVEEVEAIVWNTENGDMDEGII